jgi:hypothetical protein
MLLNENNRSLYADMLFTPKIHLAAGTYAGDSLNRRLQSRHRLPRHGGQFVLSTEQIMSESPRAIVVVNFNKR